MQQSRNDAMACDEEKKYGFGFEAADFFSYIFKVVLVTVLLFVALCRHAVVDGDSMNPTFLNADKLIVSNLLYTPERGDVVAVFEETNLHKPLIKRVIGVAGDVIRIDYNAGIVYVNGVAQDEPYTAAPTYRPGDIEYPVTVAEGCYFVMGDNRNESLDSRWSSVGQIAGGQIIGKVVLRFYPFSSFTVFGNE